MTAAATAPAMVCATIDGVNITVPKGTLIIRAAERIGIEIPRFCDHPLLEPVAACRMCLVEIEGQPKPQPGCAIPLAEGMVVKTQLTSEISDTAQHGVMEFLLINHPLDCPICDKGGECPLQNQAMTHGRGDSRFTGPKRTFPKPIPVSAQILLDRERCISCTRCTRFADEIAGDPLIDLQDRGSHQQIGIGEDEPFDSYFSGNTIQICPVGALTSADYRFKARPFDLVSTPTICEHCAAGCALRTDVRHGTVQRRLAGEDYLVNEAWNCDKGRFAFDYLASDRLTTPLIRDNGQLRPAAWPEAIAVAAAGLAAKLRDSSAGGAAVFPGGRLAREDAYAYAKFARVSLGTDNIDFRARAGSDEEIEFLGDHVGGTGLGVTYADLEQAPLALLVAFEPEDEAPIVFLRLRKAARSKRTRIVAVAPWASPGLVKAGATLLSTVPGREAAVLNDLAAIGGDVASGESAVVAADLRKPGAVILVGERLATSPGGLLAAAALAAQTGARLAWVPRRAGERGAVDAGALAGLLPTGRLDDEATRDRVAAAWGIAAAQLPQTRGMTASQLARIGQPVGEPAGQSSRAVVLGGVDPDDFADPDAFRQLVAAADFVVSLETRRTELSESADVVFPVAVDTERAGSYVNWEGRIRSFAKTMRHEQTLTDGRVLALLADALDRPIGSGDSTALAAELDSLFAVMPPRLDERPQAGAPTANVATATLPAGQAVLSTWRQLLDCGTLQDGEKYLAGTRRPALARMSSSTAAAIGAMDGTTVTVSTGSGSITLPLSITPMPDGVVWVPTNSPDSRVNASLHATSGQTVQVSAGGAQ